ncbi:MAG: hypothetical protein Q9166_008177 [cf. Caloplaca sp. 2 TL-2023]
MEDIIPMPKGLVMNHILLWSDVIAQFEFPYLHAKTLSESEADNICKKFGRPSSERSLPIWKLDPHPDRIETLKKYNLFSIKADQDPDAPLGYFMGNIDVARLMIETWEAILAEAIENVPTEAQKGIKAETTVSKTQASEMVDTRDGLDKAGETDKAKNTAEDVRPAKGESIHSQKALDSIEKISISELIPDTANVPAGEAEESGGANSTASGISAPKDKNAELGNASPGLE